MKDKYWIVIGLIFFILIGYFMAFTLQYSYHAYYGTLMDWNRIYIGGLLLGLILFAPVILLILFEIINLKKEVKTLEVNHE